SNGSIGRTNTISKALNSRLRGLKFTSAEESGGLASRSQCRARKQFRRPRSPRRHTSVPAPLHTLWIKRTDHTIITQTLSPLTTLEKPAERPCGDNCWLRFTERVITTRLHLKRLNAQTLRR